MWVQIFVGRCNRHQHIDVKIAIGQGSEDTYGEGEGGWLGHVLARHLGRHLPCEDRHGPCSGWPPAVIKALNECGTNGEVSDAFVTAAAAGNAVAVVIATVFAVVLLPPAWG